MLTKPNQIKSEVIVVTPEIALAWLDKNTHNRKIRRRVLARLAADMRNGKWVYTDTPILFDIHGNLIDGQHRLCAIIESGVSVMMRVTYNIDPDAQNVIDTGAPRSSADMLHLQGVPNSQLVVGVIRTLIAEIQGKPSRSLEYTNEQILAFFERHPNIPLYLVLASRMPKGIAPANISAMHYLGASILDRREEAEMMVRTMTQGIPAYEGCPMLALRERLIRVNANTDNKKIKQIDRDGQWEMLKSAWKVLCDGGRVYRPPRVPATRITINGLRQQDLVGKDLLKFTVDRIEIRGKVYEKLVGRIDETRVAKKPKK